MFLLLLALAQAGSAAGDVRIQRESDPVAVCMVTTAVESLKTASPVNAFDRTPIVVRQDPVATVTWKGAKSGGKVVEVVCQANAQTRQVTSIKVAGQEILTAPQPF